LASLPLFVARCRAPSRSRGVAGTYQFVGMSKRHRKNDDYRLRPSV
jgi:hypothetical protein